MSLKNLAAGLLLHAPRATVPLMVQTEGELDVA